VIVTGAAGACRRKRRMRHRRLCGDRVSFFFVNGIGRNGIELGLLNMPGKHALHRPISDGFLQSNDGVLGRVDRSRRMGIALLRAEHLGILLAIPGQCCSAGCRCVFHRAFVESN